MTSASPSASAAAVSSVVTSMLSRAVECVIADTVPGRCAQAADPAVAHARSLLEQPRVAPDRELVGELLDRAVAAGDEQLDDRRSVGRRRARRTGLRGGRRGRLAGR